MKKSPGNFNDQGNLVKVKKTKFKSASLKKLEAIGKEIEVKNQKVKKARLILLAVTTMVIVVPLVDLIFFFRLLNCQ